MRGILAVGIALLFALPTALAADTDPDVELNDVVPVEIVEVAELDEVERVDLRLGDAQVESAEVIEDVEAPATTQPDRQWWWLVGAIVIAGIILAVIL